LVQQREGGASALAFAGGDLVAFLERAGLCTEQSENSGLCQSPVGSNSGSLAEAVASIVRRLAETGRELLPIIALGLVLAAMGALALATAGRRSDKPSLSTVTFGDMSLFRTSNV
jgi:hypothetical protein